MWYETERVYVCMRIGMVRQVCDRFVCVRVCLTLCVYVAPKNTKSKRTANYIAKTIQLEILNKFQLKSKLSN